ncbi:MAG: GNAT family N-acetyltransferase [bacterium]|nr:GNAT family N-acetyltransferase [bacterium]
MLDVRSGRVADVDLIVDFQVRMAKETEGMDLDRETVTRGVQAVFDDPSKGTYWIAEQEGEGVGGLLTVPEWSDWRNGTVLWIHSVYVVPEARKQGVFRALYQTLKERVEASEDLCGLRLYVEKGNTRAQQVYEAMGMDGEHYQLYEWLK